MGPKALTALITGASGGIGYELAKLFAKDHYNLVLVARSSDKLNQVASQLRQQFGLNVEAMALDLAQDQSVKMLFEHLKGEKLEVDVLVNNAGFGVFGEFAEMPEEEVLGQVQLNVVALTHLTRLFLPAMIDRRQGKIMNVASTAAFQPGPLMAVYYATKAYVLSFSEAWQMRSPGLEWWSAVFVRELPTPASETCRDRELTAVQENWGDERGNGGSGWISRIDGGKDAGNFGDAELASGGVGQICATEVGDGHVEVGSRESGIETARMGDVAPWSDDRR